MLTFLLSTLTNMSIYGGQRYCYAMITPTVGQKLLFRNDRANPTSLFWEDSHICREELMVSDSV